MHEQSDDSFRLLAAQYIHKQAKALSRHLAQARSARDVEDVHQCRVTSRRLRSALRTFESCFPTPHLKTCRKAMKRVTCAMGQARDLDIQLIQLEKDLADLTDPKAGPGVARLHLRLSQQRGAVQPKVARAVDRVQSDLRLNKMIETTAEILGDLKRRDVRPDSPCVLAHGREFIARRLDDMLAWQDSLGEPLAIDRHHQMRIRAKQLRYTMESCAPAYDGALDGFIKQLKQVQTLLGNMHDCDVWAALLESFEAAERRRTADYYGHTRPFGRLAKGIAHIRTKRAAERDEHFSRLRTLWRALKQGVVWDKLAATLDRYASPPPTAQPRAPSERPTEPSEGAYRPHAPASESEPSPRSDAADREAEP